MLRWLKALPLAIAALIVFATFAASCGSNNSQARFVNAISDDHQSLDIDFNGTKAFGGVGPFAASGSAYVGVPTGSDKIQGFASGTTTSPVFTVTSPISFNSGSQYTVVATGFLAGTVNIVAPVDNNTAPAVASVNFRVIDASPSGVGAVDIYIIPNSAAGTPSCILSNGGCTVTISDVSSPLSSTTPYSGYTKVNYNSLGNFGYTMYVTPTTQITPVQNWSGGYQIPEIGSVSVGSI
ncbi:MAG: DUF4397 domain-containing protein, partial [Terriglobales bacterium]